MPDTITRCWLDTCREPAHVVVYATGDRLGGLATRMRQPVVFCLAHGGQLYDVMKAWKASDHPLPDSVNAKRRRSSPCPNWLVADLRNGRLPRTSPDPNGWPPASPAATYKARKTWK